MNCLLCDSEITDASNTEEHIIPRAIGGRRVVRHFICKGCNDSSGATWEAKIARQLQPLSLLFKIKRQKGKTPALNVITSANEALTISTEGLSRSAPKITRGPGGETIQIVARSEAEARHILERLKRKHSSIGVDAELAKGEVKDSYAEGYVKHDLTFAGPVAGRSIVKSCLALAHSRRLGWNICAHGTNYIRDDNAEPPFGFYYETDLIERRDPTMPLHCVHICANPKTGLILGYAEYYGIHRVVVGLAEGYDGALFQATYAIDPRVGKTVDLKIAPLAFTKDDLLDVYQYKRIPDGAIERATRPIFEAALARQHAAEQKRAIRSTTEYAFANCGAKPGEMLTEEQTRKLISLVGEKLTPFISSRLRRPNPA